MTKRRHLNLKRLACLVVAFLPLGVGMHLVHGYQVTRNVGILLHQAEKAEGEQQLKQAADYYGRYLLLAPKDTDALAKYGLLLANEKLATNPKALFRALLTLEQVLRRDADRHDVRRRVIQIAMDRWLKRYRDAAEHLDALMKAVGEDAELLSLRAECHEATGQYKHARQGYEEALRHPPVGIDTYVRLAYLLRVHASEVMRPGTTPEALTAEADAKVQEMITAHGNSFRSYLYGARYHKQFNSVRIPDETRKRVEQYIRKARELAPDEADLILASADLEQENKNPENARAELRRGIEHHDKDWRLYQALARLELTQERPREAVETLRKGLEKLPLQPDLQWNLAHLFIHTNQSEKASQLLDQMAKKAFPQAELDYLKARLLVNSEEWLKAARLLEHTYPLFFGRTTLQHDWFSFNLAQESNLLLARCYEQLGDHDRALAAYNRVVTRDPRSAAGRLGLARSEWVLGRLEIAEREYNQLTQFGNAPAAAWVELAQLLLVRNSKTTGADWTAVDRILTQAEKLKPVPVEAKLLRAEMLIARKEFAKARGVLTGGSEDGEPKSVQVWAGLAVLEERQGNADLALSVLDEAEKQIGDRIELRLVRARLWARRGGPAAPRALDGVAQGLEKFNAADQRRLSRAAAEAYLQIGETKRAEALWQQISDRHPNDMGSRLALYDLAVQAGDVASMATLVAQLHGIEGEEGSLWRFCKASQLITESQAQRDGARLRQAGELLAVVANRRPSWSRVCWAQGLLQEQLGDFDGALAKYRQAVALGDHSPNVIRRAVQMLTSRGRFSEADEMIQKLRDQGTGLIGLERVAAEVALNKQDSTQALVLAEKAVPPDSKDYRDHIWLGQIRWAAGKQPEAEAALRQATKIAGDVPDTWVALTSYLVRIGEKTKAKAVILEAQDKLPPGRAPVALAQCYELIGEAEQAKTFYEKALAEQPEDITLRQHLASFCLRSNQLAEARKHFEKIITMKSGTSPEAAQARRGLAIVLASAGNYQETLKALELLGLLGGAPSQVPAPGSDNLADERAKIVILATAQNPRQRRQAIELLERLLQRQLLNTQERFLLAQLYNSVGDWPKSREQLLFLLTSMQEKLDPKTNAYKAVKQQYGTYLAYTCAGLLRHDSINEAHLWLAKLENLEPESFRTLSLRAQVLAKQGQAEGAVPGLLALAKGDEKLLGAVAGVLEKIGQTKVAEELYKQYASQPKPPEATLALAQFLGRQNRLEEALPLCEKAWKTCPAEAVASASVLVLYVAKPKEDDCQRVAGWLEKAIQDNPTKGALVSQLAAVRRLQKDYRGVIAIYRQVLQHDSKDTLVLNNLAWLLALQDGNGAEALKVIQQAITLDGPRPNLLDTRAVAHLAMRNSSEAIKDLTEAITELPKASSYFHLAQAYHQVDRHREAVDAFERANRLGLTENTVDPLERPVYQRLRVELRRKKI